MRKFDNDIQEELYYHSIIDYCDFCIKEEYERIKDVDLSVNNDVYIDNVQFFIKMNRHKATAKNQLIIPTIKKAFILTLPH